MSKLPYLISEINSAIEVYLSGRTGQQYNRTAFILCDDGAELASKLFLLTDTPTWDDRKAKGHFKRFNEITKDVRAVFKAKRAAEYDAVDALLINFEGRRGRRNDFFHSTHLLDLTVQGAECVRAFVDLLDYGKLLFGADWDAAVVANGTMETCEAVLRIDKKSFADPSVHPLLNDVLKRQPRSGPKPTKCGCEISHHPEDIHLRLVIRNGGKELKDELQKLL